MSWESLNTRLLGWYTMGTSSTSLITMSMGVMDIGYFSYFLSLYLLDKETQRNTYLNPCSEFILNFLDINYSQMTPIRKQSFLLKLEPLLEPLPFRLCLIQ